jgi:hypothetical protein
MKEEETKHLLLIEKMSAMKKQYEEDYYELFDLLKEIEQIYCRGKIIYSKDNKKQCIVFNDEQSEKLDKFFNDWLKIYGTVKGWNV